MVVYRRSPRELLVCVNAANREKDHAWLAERAAGAGAEVVDASGAWGQLALQGPAAPAILQRLTATRLGGVGRYRFAEGDVAGVPCLIARTGYTGEDGFELFCPAERTVQLWEALLEAGAPEGLQPCGLGARDTLRLEMAYRLYGADMDETTTPLEAGLAWAVKLDKGDFSGREALVAQRERPVSPASWSASPSSSRGSRATATRCCRRVPASER